MFRFLFSFPFFLLISLRASLSSHLSPLRCLLVSSGDTLSDRKHQYCSLSILWHLAFGSFSQTKTGPRKSNIPFFYILLSIPLINFLFVLFGHFCKCVQTVSAFPSVAESFLFLAFLSPPLPSSFSFLAHCYLLFFQFLTLLFSILCLIFLAHAFIPFLLHPFLSTFSSSPPPVQVATQCRASASSAQNLAPDELRWRRKMENAYWSR